MDEARVRFQTFSMGKNTSNHYVDTKKRKINKKKKQRENKQNCVEICRLKQSIIALNSINSSYIHFFVSSEINVSFLY